MNVVDFISRLLHIINLPSLVVLTPPHLPYTPSANYAHLFANCDISRGICFIPYYCVQNFILKGEWYGSFFVVAFNFLKSIQIFNLSFFFDTTIIGDNHVASYTN
jgi:hypothetical protein